MNRIKRIFKTVLAIFITTLISCSDNDDSNDFNHDKYINIQDAGFEKALIKLNIDTDGIVDQKILRVDAEKITKLELISDTNDSIVSLTGIEGFKNLTYLAVAMNSLTSVDLSQNIKLDTVYLPGNMLTTIDISKNINLILLHIDSNELTTITGISDAEKLKSLHVSFNYIESLNINSNSLVNLYASNNSIKTIDLGESTNLETVLLKTNKLKTIDFKKSTKLIGISLSDNEIENIELDKNIKLKDLYISSNSLKHLDVSALDLLTHLIVNNNVDLSCIKIKNGQNIPTVIKSDYQQLNSVCN